MKFHYNKIIVNTKDCSYVTYDLNYTTEDDKYLIKLINQGIITPVIFNNKLNYALVFNTMECEDDYNYEEELELRYYETNDYLIIDTCPVGGCKIEILIDNIVDKTIEYNDLLIDINSIKMKKGRKSKEDLKMLEYLELKKGILLLGRITSIDNNLLE